MKKIYLILICVFKIHTAFPQFMAYDIETALETTPFPLCQLSLERDSVIILTHFKRPENQDSLKLMNTLTITSIDGKLMKSTLKKNKSLMKSKQYWICEDGKIHFANKSGKTKNESKGANLIRETNSTVEGEDSVIFSKRLWIRESGDTTCEFLVKKVYHNDTLKEVWRNYGMDTSCNWMSVYNYSKTSFSYPDEDLELRIVEDYRNYKLESTTYQRIKRTFSEEKKLMKVEFEYNEWSRFITYYNKGIITRDEIWIHDVLDEYVEISYPEKFVGLPAKS